jgi:hypothetical protein
MGEGFMRILGGFVFLVAILISAQAHALSDEEIAQILIKRSIASYSGNCPCPYNTDRAGRRCGKRSAYSKPGGYQPLCYKEDVTKNAIESYKKINR